MAVLLRVIRILGHAAVKSQLRNRPEHPATRRRALTSQARYGGCLAEAPLRGAKADSLRSASTLQLLLPRLSETTSLLTIIKPPRNLGKPHVD